MFGGVSIWLGALDALLLLSLALTDSTAQTSQAQSTPTPRSVRRTLWLS